MSDAKELSEADAPKVVNGELKNDLFQTVLNPPDWLNQDYLEKALANYEHDKTLKITDCSIVPATKPGDNFASVVFRAHITFTSKKYQAPGEKLSYIIKVKPFLEGMKKDMMGDVPFFETEIKMYTSVLPEMQRLLSQTGDSDIIAPTLIHHGLNPDIVIFEDISKYGYTARHEPLSYEDTHQLFVKLAKLHALSYYIQNESILDLTQFNLGLFTTDIVAKFDLLPHSFNSFIDAVKEYGGEFNEIVQKLEALKPVYVSLLKKIYKPNNNGFGFNVLNHGDFHIRNLLFRYEGDHLDHISFIDFQICIWATPAIDIYYALYAMATNDVRERQHELLRAYHDRFCLVLTDLGYLKKPPSLLDLHIEILRHGFLEVFMTSSFLPIFFMDFSAFAEEAKDKQENGFDLMIEVTKKIFKQEPVKTIVSKLLRKFLHNGLLELP
uniref:Putative ecdysteroid kinase n=1 Tax=Nyssomyia neivai TaxID=330878 RepID=A0A1L8DYJ3_9DIPT